MLLRASYFKLKWFLCLIPFMDRNKSGFVSWFYFPTLMPTQVAFIFMLLAPVKEREGEWESEQERRVWISFFPPLFLHLFLNKNTLNPFWGMLRIRSNRLFFSPLLSLFFSPSRVTSGMRLSLSPSFSLFPSHTLTHMHTRVRTEGPCGRAF